MPDLFLFFMYSFIFTLIIATWQRLHCCIIAFSFVSSPKWYTYCRPCMWCFINGSTVWLLSWKSREILLSVSFSKLGSVLLTFKATWQAHICFSCFSGCNLLSQCCNSYEFCVSCCLNPSRVYLCSFFFSFSFSGFILSLSFFKSIFTFLEFFCRHKRNRYWRWKLLNKQLQVKCCFWTKKIRIVLSYWEVVRSFVGRYSL